ncbi:MAG: 16S rRNA processing protein RimM [Clostridiales bacterium]|nr:16S rRNA processing protein RimM [Clostridiales bacterium]
MKEYLEIGKIVSVFGLNGEVKVHPWCDSPDFLTEFDTLYWKSGDGIEILSARVQKNLVVMKIKDCDTVEDAQKLRNRVLYMNRSEVELDEGCYFIQDLVGLTVKDLDTGEVYGKITDVSETGANDIYHIETEKGKLIYVPAIPEVVIETNLEDGIMIIKPLEGLFED